MDEEIKVNDRYYVEIINIGEQGDAVAKVNGMVVFIKDNTLSIGDKVNIEITKVLPKFGFAVVIPDEE